MNSAKLTSCTVLLETKTVKRVDALSEAMARAWPWPTSQPPRTRDELLRLCVTEGLRVLEAKYPPTP